MQEHGKHDKHSNEPHHPGSHGHDHGPPIRQWLQPVIATGIALIATIAVLVLLTQIVTDTPTAGREDDAAVLARIKPVGELQFAAASGPKGQLTGEQVYGQVCKTCHEAGLAGAPKVGDKTAWGKVIAQGQATAVDHAIKGIRAMPPKGGNPDLENVEVERAVAFMASKAGATWKEPPVTAATASAPASSSVSPVATAAAAVPTAAAAGGKPDGKKVYDTTCMACHSTGAAGAPKFGDKAAWKTHLAHGAEHLYANALNGVNAMPPKGGNAALSDAEVKAAVDYMVAAAK